MKFKWYQYITGKERTTSPKNKDIKLSFASFTVFPTFAALKKVFPLRRE